LRILIPDRYIQLFGIGGVRENRRLKEKVVFRTKTERAAVLRILLRVT
tara:strand:- start:572 stop:715 length:144 start_codon:yes stop_codon:yes gene_type:complete